MLVSEEESILKGEEQLPLAAGNAATQKGRFRGARPFNGLKCSNLDFL